MENFGADRFSRNWSRVGFKKIGAGSFSLKMEKGMSPKLMEQGRFQTNGLSLW